MKITGSRPLWPLFFAIFVLAIAAAPSVDAANPETDRAAGTESSELMGGWHFVRTRHPQGGADAISIMHTADVSKSDLDFVGLMIRCREGATEAVIVLLRPFPLRARPNVLFGKPENETHFEATIAAPGTAILIPGDAAALVRGPWQAQNDLIIRVDDGQSTIRGVVALTGLRAAFKILLSSCRAQ